MLLLSWLLPQLEFATGRGPALHVDAHGIWIARWVPLEIPWSEVQGASVFSRYEVVVHTSDPFAES